MNQWIDDLQRLTSDEQQCVVVTVAGVRGSAPREVGAKMIVSANATLGTIGGGQLEYQCTRIAVQQMRQQGAYAGARLQRRFPLGTNCGQCCGGVVDVLFERVAFESDPWLTDLKQFHDERHPVVLVTPLAEDPGKYLLTKDRCKPFATSCMCPDDVLAAAKIMLDGHDSAEVVGGFLLEPVLQSDFHIAIFGAGHVGAATIDVLSRLDCNIRWIDSRRNIFRGTPSNARAVETCEPALEVAAMPPRSCYLIMTHSHALDFDICDRVLRRGDAIYCGLIGSLSKRRRFEKRFRSQGMQERDLERLVCPIGVAGISGKKPAEIAVSAAAEVLQAYERATRDVEHIYPDNVHPLARRR